MVKWSAWFHGDRLILTTREVEPTIEMVVRDPPVRPLRPAPSPAMWRAERKRPTGMCTWSWEYLALWELVKLILVFHVSSSTCRYLNTISFWDQLSREGRAKRSRRDSGVAWRIRIRARGSHRRPPSCSDCRLVKSYIFWHTSTKFHCNIPLQGAW